MWLCAGCGTFRWGERTPGDWAEITADKETERHFLFKPTRDLKDPRWTMDELTSANQGFNLTDLLFFDPFFWNQDNYHVGLFPIQRRLAAGVAGVKLECKKRIIMKKTTSMLSIVCATALLLGCSSTKQKENLLSAAGFKPIAANSPQRVEHLKSLSDDRLTTANLNGHNYFVFPDWAENVLFVGQEPQYQQYQRMRLENELPEARVETAEVGDAWAGWGAWGRW